MNEVTLFRRELRYRAGTFLLGVLGVAAAAGCLSGARAFLAAHDHRTEELVAALQERSGGRMAQLRDEARRFSLNLGFNTLLLPPGQALSELHTQDRSTRFFSAPQVEALAAAGLETLNHLRPILRERTAWLERTREVILVGVRGEVYIKSPRWQKPIEQAIAPGMAHVGSALARDLGLEPGAAFKLHGRDFRVEHVLPQAGEEEDISLRIELTSAQEILGRPGGISGILAVTCDCADADPELVRREVDKFIAGIQVVSFTSRAQARHQARTAIARGTEEEADDIRSSRAALRAQVADMAGILVVVVTAGTIVLLGVLTLNSARERRPEVAMLRALGLRASRILALFLGKALLTGVLGGAAGCALGAASARLLAGPGARLSPGFALLVCIVAAGVAVLASLLPAAWAARQDPAGILNQE